MAKSSELLQKRANVWWFRKRVPRDVTSLLKTEILWSLQTPDLREAKRLRDVKRLEAQRLIDDARAELYASPPEPTGQTRVPSEGEAIGMVKQWLRSAVSYYEDTPLEAFDSRDRMPGYMFFDETKPHSLDGAFGLVDHLLQVSGYDDYPTHVFVTHDDGTRRFQRGRAAPSVIRNMRTFAQAAMLEAKKFLKRRLEPAAEIRFNPVFSIENTVDVLKQTTVEMLIAQFCADRKDPHLTKKTAEKHAAYDAAIKEIIGAKKLVTSVTRADVRQFRTIFTVLPANHTKTFPGVRRVDFLEMSSERRGKPMAAITANGYVTALCTLLKYAAAEDLISKNPALNLRPIKDDKPRLKRRSFKPDELKKVFDAPLYRGCIDDEENYNSVGSSRPRRHRYWLPLLLLFTGARANEMCQLTCDDIYLESGIAVFNLRFDPERGKRVKNDQSQRLVPIHSQLVTLGFLGYIEGVRRRHGERSFVFPELLTGSTGFRSQSVSRWFARFLDHQGLTDPRLCLHSMRHTFRDALGNGGVSSERVSGMTGWTEGGGMAAHYGDGAKVEVLAGDIEKGDFDLDLSHLVPRS